MPEQVLTMSRRRCGCVILMGNLRANPESLPCPNPGCPEGHPPEEKLQINLTLSAVPKTMEMPLYLATIQRVKSAGPTRRPSKTAAMWGGPHNRFFWSNRWGDSPTTATVSVPSWRWEIVGWEKQLPTNTGWTLSMERAHLLIAVLNQPDAPGAAKQKAIAEWELVLRGLLPGHVQAAVRADTTLRSEWGQPIPTFTEQEPTRGVRRGIR